MKTMKKLGAIMLVLAMCTMLMTLVSAVSLSGAVYSAASDKEIYCPSDEVQYITVTVKPDQSIDLASFDAYALVPAGWSIVSIENDDLTLFEEAIKPAENRIMWFALVPSTETESGWTLENHTTDVLAKITYKIPANAEEGEYTVGFTNVELMRNKATDGHIDPDVYVGTEENPVTITTTVTIGHTWEIEYRDNGDGTHTAYEACACGQTNGDGATVDHDFTNGECVCGAEKPVQPVGMKGDVDLDGDVDSDDAVAIFKHALDAELLTDPVALLNAEVTGDDTINSDDAVKVFKFALQAIDSLD